MSRRILSVLSAIGAVIAGTTVGLAPSADASPPWTAGTVFIASSGLRHSDGGVFSVAPGQSKSLISSGTVGDVAVSSDGTVYWTDCDSGAVLAYRPGVGQTTVRSGLQCPDGIAVEPNGDLLVSDYSANLYRLARTGAIVSTIATGFEAESIAIDPSGNAYLIDGGADLALLPAGASTAVQTSGTPYDGSLSSVRLGPNSVLVEAVRYPAGIATTQLGTNTATYTATGTYSLGAVSDRSGNRYSSLIVDDPSTQDEVSELPVSGGAHVLANGIDYPEGLAVYPAVVPAARSASTTTLTTTSPTTPAAWQQVHLRADLGSGVHGYVQFADDGNPIGDAVALDGGVARTVTQLPAGSDHVTATYLGSGTVQPSQSSALDFTVSSVATTTTLATSDPTDEPDGSTVTVTATVSSQHGTPDGDVDLYLGSQQVGFGELDGSGTASGQVTLSGLHPNVHAVYDGSPTYRTSTSNTLHFAATTPYIPTLSTSTTYGRPHANGSELVTIAVKVQGYAGIGAPTGTVDADSGFSCDPLVGGHVPALSITHCTAVVPNDAFDDVTIDYNGDSHYAPESTYTSVEVGG